MRRVLVLAAIVGLLACGVASARPCAGGGSSGPPSVLIIMDASKSMASRLDAGGTRLDAAKIALRGLVADLPDRALVGLRLYGHRVSGAGRAAGCRDTELVAPVARLDRATLESRIDSFRAVGSTPIGRALRAGAADLPATGPTSIVLVSDGGDNCAPPDPCRVAAEITGARTTISIQTIGFQVSSRARSQLRCIAARGRGVYRDASDTHELAAALRALSARAMRTFGLDGEQIAGGTSYASATPIASGLFLDRVRPDDQRWYSIALRRGQRLAATAIVVSPCPVDHDVVDTIGTSLGLDVIEPGTGLPLQRRSEANVFFSDHSFEGTGLLTPRIGPQPDDFQAFARPGRYRLRFTLEDNGLGSFARAFADAPIALQIQTRVIGDAGLAGRSRHLAAGDARPHAGPRLLVAVIVICGAVGLLAGGLLALARRRARA